MKRPLYFFITNNILQLHRQFQRRNVRLFEKLRVLKYFFLTFKLATLPSKLKFFIYCPQLTEIFFLHISIATTITSKMFLKYGFSKLIMMFFLLSHKTDNE